jgi:dihydropteroate synthase
MTPFSLNIRGKLCRFERPTVMGILNATPDSFYAGSRAQTDDEIASRASQLAAEGAEFIDVGAYSTRPGATEVSPDEEAARLLHAIPIVRQVAPQAIISVDTFRADVARKAVEAGADIINDVAGGNLDDAMFDTVAALGVPYILMHMRGTPADMQQYTDYTDLTRDVLAELGERLQRLALMGVNDIIIDPGFGFSKTLDQNYELLHNLELFQLFHRPVLVGVSRKSMATKLLGITTDQALNATTVINTISLQKGAAILRVHDVKAAREAVEIFCKTLNPSI